MPQPANLTSTVLLVCFAGALAAFFLTAVGRWLAARRRTPGPPPLPQGRVAVWPYHAVDLLWMGFIVFTFGAVSLETSQLAERHTEVSASVSGIIISMGFQLVLAGMTVVVMAWRIGPITWLGLRWQEWPRVLLIAPLTVVAMWVLNIALFLCGYLKWIESLGVEQVQDSVKLLNETPDPIIFALMAVTAVLVAPVCEEILFRGYLYGAAKRFAGPWVAGIGSALIFAAAHGSLMPLPPLFILGFLLVLAYEWTGSLWAPIGIHLCFNGATVLIQLAARFHLIPLPDSL